MKVEVNVPLVLRFMDCHEILSFAEDLNKIFKNKIKFQEIECHQSSYYYAIFYFKQDQEYQKLIKKYKEIGDTKK